MKKNILFLFAFIFIGCVTVDLTERSNIIDLPGQSKQQIYQKSVQWTTHEFASGRATIDYKNQEVGKINANGLIFLDTVAGSSRSVYMVIAIDCAAGKARINVIPK